MSIDLPKASEFDSWLIVPPIIRKYTQGECTLIMKFSDKVDLVNISVVQECEHCNTFINLEGVDGFFEFTSIIPENEVVGIAVSNGVDNKFTTNVVMSPNPRVLFFNDGDSLDSLRIGDVAIIRGELDPKGKNYQPIMSKVICKFISDYELPRQEVIASWNDFSIYRISKCLTQYEFIELFKFVLDSSKLRTLIIMMDAVCMKELDEHFGVRAKEFWDDVDSYSGDKVVHLTFYNDKVTKLRRDNRVAFIRKERSFIKKILDTLHRSKDTILYEDGKLKVV